eukprot:TRINITY_DN16985_c0_g2_i1.p9 TRINITY_DN16985_c0_g2~~TRINITY_DN16985_c0_g2_i1.p9  ORF type:complete len:100 (+),score=1.95 TRINITY_DN16985_c0_g2_i1:2497-2796(+)
MQKKPQKGNQAYFIVLLEIIKKLLVTMLAIGDAAKYDWLKNYVIKELLRYIRYVFKRKIWSEQKKFSITEPQLQPQQINKGVHVVISSQAPTNITSCCA